MVLGIPEDSDQNGRLADDGCRRRHERPLVHEALNLGAGDLDVLQLRVDVVRQDAAVSCRGRVEVHNSGLLGSAPRTLGARSFPTKHLGDCAVSL